MDNNTTINLEKTIDWEKKAFNIGSFRKGRTYPDTATLKADKLAVCKNQELKIMMVLKR